MPKGKKVKTKKGKGFKVFKGEYLGVGDEEKVHRSVQKAHELPHLLMTEAKPTTEREASRIIRQRGLMPRITPKTPRLRR